MARMGMNNGKDYKAGLSKRNIMLIVWVSFFAILFWQPLDVRPVISYSSLILIPIALWFFLSRFGSKWEIDERGNDRIWRGVVGIIAGVLFFNAYLYATADYHYECDQLAGHGENQECVGEYVSVDGPDIVKALMTTAFGVLATYLAIATNDNYED